MNLIDFFGNLSSLVCEKFFFEKTSSRSVVQFLELKVLNNKLVQLSNNQSSELRLKLIEESVRLRNDIEIC
jgi:hypothetical protein